MSGKHDVLLSLISQPCKVEKVIEDAARHTS
jgi:hypothetical protein